VTIGMFAAEGIALAFVLFFGRSVIPGIFLGQLLLALSNDISLFASTSISVINSAEAFIGYTLFQKFKLNVALKNFKDVLGLIGIILFIQLLSASLANVILILNHTISPEMFLISAFSWWFGNVMGQLLVSPFLLLLFVNYEKIDFEEYILYTLLFGLFLYFLEIVLNVTNLMLLLSLSTPFIVFIVSYRGFTYGTFFSVILALVSSYAVYLQTGAFCLQDTVENTINYNLFVLAHITIVFITGVLFEERKKLQESLENKIVKEVTKNKEQQLILLEQSRLAQMGEMIAMIAHQWRQPLNNLSLSNQLLVSKYYKGKLNDKMVDSFKETSKRQITHMSKTIDDFRNFFKSELKVKEFCVNDVVNDILNITQGIYDTYAINLNFSASREFYAKGYSNELGQAILNIINNAKDALIETQRENKFINISLQDKGENILLSIEDNANGIPEKIATKIFDPYFSTKESKNGTGLGLYMSKMVIVEKFNGHLTFTNTTQGVKFEITFKEINRAT
jgi:signal transduction histidine kinase